MITINLLESVTDRPKGLPIAESKPKSSGPKTLLIILSIGAVLMIALCWDYFSTNNAKAAADKELVRQKEIARQMELIIKEQDELKKKIAAVDSRIDAIKQLRANQSGPGAVLRALKERIDMAPGLYLESVEQKGNVVVVKGNSPNENTVTAFGRSLEFSSGLFSNLNIETARRDMVFADPNGGNAQAPGSNDPKAVKPETVSFTIKCDYTPSAGSAPPPAPSSSAAVPPSNVVAKK
jgi:Tfp pilus assembly protein PilN